ncbi:unnamed protein product [Blepharisma stoltei]|uniref:Uncharacterized protein n=1 Tax=Blepharisma stoltei TaxID=1481888 RepID=A0AAU9J3T5_9CILI|nr:unnamed protein product [Blepharisma stoltei]
MSSDIEFELDSLINKASSSSLDFVRGFVLCDKHVRRSFWSRWQGRDWKQIFGFIIGSITTAWVYKGLSWIAL